MDWKRRKNSNRSLRDRFAVDMVPFFPYCDFEAVKFISLPFIKLLLLIGSSKISKHSPIFHQTIFPPYLLAYISHAYPSADNPSPSLYKYLLAVFIVKTDSLFSNIPPSHT